MATLGSTKNDGGNPCRLDRVMPRGVLVGCLAPSGLSATRSSPSPLSSTSVVDALFIPRWETLKRWSIQHFPPPPRAPRRARFPRPPLEKRDGQFNISPPDRDRFIFVSSFAAYLATYPSAADRDRFTFVSSFAAYLATYRSHHVRRRPERLNCLRPSPFSARLQFVQKVNRLHFLRVSIF